MFQARQRRIGDKYSKVVVCTASDQTAMESIVSAQKGLQNAHDLVQHVNIAILKIYSILVSRAPKVLVSLITFLLSFAFVQMSIFNYKQQYKFSFMLCNLVCGRQ